MSTANTVYIRGCRGYDRVVVGFTPTCASVLKLWVRIPLIAKLYSLQHHDTSDQICHWLETGQWFSPGTPVSSNNTDCHVITEILLNLHIEFFYAIIAYPHQSYTLYMCIYLVYCTLLQCYCPKSVLNM